MTTISPRILDIFDNLNSDTLINIVDCIHKASNHLYSSLVLSGKIIDDIGAFSTANHHVKSTSGFDDIYKTNSNPFQFSYSAKLAETRLHIERLQIIRNHQVLAFSTIGKDLMEHKDEYVLYGISYSLII